MTGMKLPAAGAQRLCARVEGYLLDMASYSATVSSDRAPDEIFDYLADFRSVQDWDPSIIESTHVNADEPIQVGSIFSVTTKTAAKEIVLEYKITELQRPNKIVLVGENDSMISTDTIAITQEGAGSEVTYDAEIELKGVRKLADPIVDLGFHRLGDKARDGLQQKLNEA